MTASFLKQLRRPATDNKFDFLNCRDALEFTNRAFSCISVYVKVETIQIIFRVLQILLQSSLNF